MKKVYWFVLFIFILKFNISAQSSWEVEAVQKINPDNPNSVLFKGLTSSVAPIAIAAPLGMFAISLINHHSTLKRESIEVLSSFIIASSASQFLKRIVNRPRPYATYTHIFPDKIQNDYSFPSGHTSIAFSCATSITLISKKWYIAVPAYVWASGVGYSRIYLGQHYPSDVMMGAIVGTASGFASHWLMKKIIPVKKQPVKQIP